MSTAKCTSIRIKNKILEKINEKYPDANKSQLLNNVLEYMLTQSNMVILEFAGTDKSYNMSDTTIIGIRWKPKLLEQLNQKFKVNKTLMLNNFMEYLLNQTDDTFQTFVTKHSTLQTVA